MHDSSGREPLRAEGLAEGRAAMVRQMLLSRGIEVSEGFPGDVPGFAVLPEVAVVTAALACKSEDDFRARVTRIPGR